MLFSVVSPKTKIRSFATPKKVKLGNNMNRKRKLLVIAAVVIVLALSAGSYEQMTVAAQKIRVACVGDSITRASGYPAKLQMLLGSHYEVGNFGVDGATIVLNSSKPYMNESAYQKAIEFRPDIVVIMLGTNDANPSVAPFEGAFETDYCALINSFQTLDTDPKVWVAESPPIQNTSTVLSAPVFNQDIIPQIQQVADNLNVPTIDVYDSFQNHTDFFMDGVHPNTDGANLIASDVAIAITQDD
jgi:lysophospholipase L1-like esterase